jgi:hypothetical protein
MNRSSVVVEITMTSLLVEKNKKVTGKNQENPVENCPETENCPEVENCPEADNHQETENNYAGVYFGQLR